VEACGFTSMKPGPTGSITFSFICSLGAMILHPRRSFLEQVKRCCDRLEGLSIFLLPGEIDGRDMFDTQYYCTMQIQSSTMNEVRAVGIDG